jgi:hypothetical protein
MEGKDPFGTVPVIEKKIVEQCGADKAFHIGNFEIFTQAKAEPRHIGAVFVDRDPAVLDVFFFFRIHRVTKNCAGDPFKQGGIVHSKNLLLISFPKL